jgi:REP element-mobilizing transposase RayT
MSHSTSLRHHFPAAVQSPGAERCHPQSSNDWLRSQSPQFASFFWQAGFGAFSVSQSQIEEVRAYIRNQREHHRVKTFQEELRAFLNPPVALIKPYE